MDPNATIDEMNDLALRVLHEGQGVEDWQREQAAEELAQHFLNLDEWLSKGGLLPTRWCAGDRKLPTPEDFTEGR